MGAGGSRAATGLALKHCTLFKADRSPACRAVMMALDAMNLSVNEVDINMDKGEHRTPEMMVINNQQTLPVLKDRELILCDSHAINTYLASRYCKSERILPRDPGGRALVDQLLHYDSGVLYPRYKAAAYPILYENCRFVMPQHVCDIEGAYADLEGMLMGRTWFSGPWPSLGDISIAATVSTMHTIVPIDKMRYPRLSSWLYRVSEEMFYVTANKKGLTEFSRRVDCSYNCDESEFKCPRTSSRRRSVGDVTEPAGKLSNAAGRLAVATGMNEDIRCIYDCHCQIDQQQDVLIKSEPVTQDAELLQAASVGPANESLKLETKLETPNPELANELRGTELETTNKESANEWNGPYTIQEMVNQAISKKQDTEMEAANQKSADESQKQTPGSHEK